jgi:hypothetical protein
MLERCSENVGSHSFEFFKRTLVLIANREERPTVLTRRRRY